VSSASAARARSDGNSALSFEGFCRGRQYRFEGFGFSRNDLAVDKLPANAFLIE
jgi:hypothetical protein